MELDARSRIAMGKLVSKKNMEKQMGTSEEIKRQEVDDLNQAMLARCIPIAKSIARMIVEDDLEMGDKLPGRRADQNGREVGIPPNERPEAYRKTAEKIMQAMLDANLLWAEKELVFQLLKQPYDLLQNIVLTDLQTSFSSGINRMFGIEVFSELTFQQIDEFVKKYPTKKDQEIAEGEKPA